MPKTLIEPRPLRKLIREIVDSAVEASAANVAIEQTLAIVVDYEWDDEDHINIGLGVKGPVGAAIASADLDVQEVVERLGSGSMYYKLVVKR